MKNKLSCMLCALVFALSACGNKGDLYIPKEPKATEKVVDEQEQQEVSDRKEGK